MASAQDIPGGISYLNSKETEQGRLLSIPNEILGLIAAECDPHDLKNLRLTSRFMCKISSQAFGRKAFCRRRFIFSRKSMQGLLDITAHLVFGPHLRVITFGTCRLTSTEHDEDDEMGFYCFRGHNDDAAFASYKSKELMHKAFVQKNEHLEMLTLALRNLQACSNIGVNLGIHDDTFSHSVQRCAYGFEDAYGRFIPSAFDGAGTLRTIFAAGAKSRYPIKAIKLFVSQDHLISLTDDSDTLWKLCFDGETNGSRLKPDMDIHIGIRLFATYAKMKILSAGTRLELYSHSFERDADSNPYLKFCKSNYEFIWDAIASSPLQDVLIDKSDVEYDLFRQFLENQAESLDNLVLRNVHLIALDSPTEHTLRLLRFLKDNLELKRLKLENLTVGVGIVVPESGACVFEGHQNVSKGLQGLIDEIDAMYEDEQESSDDDEEDSSDYDGRVELAAGSHRTVLFR